MQSVPATSQPSPRPIKAQSEDRHTVYAVLFAISLVHLFNDSIQSVITAIYPILRDAMSLSYFEVGTIGFALNAVASVMQPVIGRASDARPAPWLLPLGMCSTLLGMLGLGL